MVSFLHSSFSLDSFVFRKGTVCVLEENLRLYRSFSLQELNASEYLMEDALPIVKPLAHLKVYQTGSVPHLEDSAVFKGKKVLILYSRLLGNTDVCY